ncbi:MAG: AMP-binding protein, partial [Candidatus Marinimicrobia bacterium]|nr:AMP-binding protein [Candidatus Neomarinimicrobiota bacterium]
MSETLQFTIGGLLQDTSRRFSDNDALVYPDLGIRLNYREFDQLTDRVAKGLFHIGIRKGDHVSIWANNVPEWVVLQFATA